MQLVHPVLTFGLLVRTRFALTFEAAARAVESDEAGAGAVGFSAEEVVAEIDGLLVATEPSAAPAPTPVTGVAGVLVEAAETLLLL